MTGRDFIQFVKSVPYFFALVNEGDIVGFSYLTRVTATSAHIHVVYFTDYRGKHCVIHAREALREVFGFTGLSTLVGVTPASNKRAIRFATMTGFKIVGKIEDYLWNEHACQSEAGVITQLQRETPGEGLY